jgi:hypothetical protein
MTRSLVVALVCGLASVPASAADLTEAASRGYDEYFTAARKAFVALATAAPESRPERDRARSGRGTVQPGSGDGILSRPDSLIHHWRGETFLANVTLDRAISVSQAYADYPRIFKPIRAATVLPSTAPDAFHVLFRMKASGGGLSATLDVRSRIQWVRVDERRAYVVSVAEEVREVANAGKPNERLLPEGHDSGYLWRAATMTRFVADAGGLWMVMETVGLSRPFPPVVGWLIEPIARRVGRGSVEDSMKEFAQALEDRSKLAP